MVFSSMTSPQNWIQNMKNKVEKKNTTAETTPKDHLKKNTKLPLVP